VSAHPPEGSPQTLFPKKKFFVMIGINPCPSGSIFCNVKVYSWRNRSKLYRWYGELKSLEIEVIEHPHPERIADYHAKLDRIEASVNRVNVPLAFYNDLYILREHIEMVREKVVGLNQDMPGKSPGKL